MPLRGQEMAGQVHAVAVRPAARGAEHRDGPIIGMIFDDPAVFGRHVAEQHASIARHHHAFSEDQALLDAVDEQFELGIPGDKIGIAAWPLLRPGHPGEVGQGDRREAEQA
jgi:hypothetical protein